MAVTRSRRKIITAIVRPGQDRTGLDMGVEGADQYAARFETLMIEGNAVRERRITQRSESVQRNVRQDDGSEFLAGQSHGISPLRMYFVNHSA
jgi:hypothetical protein